MERIQNPIRFRAARSDATLGTMLRFIEKIFGFPEGSLIFRSPDGRTMRSDATVRRLRKKWS